MNVRRLVRSCILVAVFAVGLVPFLPSNAGATISNPCWFTPTYDWITAGTCSLSGYGVYGTNDVLPGRPTSGGTFSWALPGPGSDYCNANPTSQRCINSKSRLISAISLARQGKDWYGNDRSGEVRNQSIVGAGFVQALMLGNSNRSWANVAYENDRWVELMNQSSVTVEFTSLSVSKSSWYDTNKNNDFFYDYNPGAKDVIIVRQNGAVLIVLEQACGNPTNDEGANLEFEWTIAPYTNMYVDGTATGATNVYPGQTVRWDHNAKNLGPHATGQAVELKEGYTLNGTFIGFYNISNKAAGWAPNTYSTAVSRTWVPDATDVGNTVCYYYRAEDHSYNDSNPVYSSQPPTKCVTVVTAASYDLIPSVSVDPSAAAPNESIDILYNVRNTGPSPVGSTRDWRVSFIKYALGQTAQPGAFNPSGNVMTSDVCSLVGAYTTCSPSSPAPATSGNFSFGGNASATSSLGAAPTITYSIPSTAAVGEKYCFITSVENPTPAVGDDTQWRYSNMSCIVVGIKPKVKILGLDARVGGLAQASKARVGVKTYGSWVEYGIFSANVNDNVGSASGLAIGHTSSLQKDWSRLTFSNTPALTDPSEAFGNYGSVGDPSNFVAQLASLCTSWRTTPVNISTISIPTNSPLCSTSTVTIDTNINDPSGAGGTTATLSTIKQNIIIARDIVIKNNVTNVNAWLIAVPDPQDPSFDGIADAGRIDTCGDRTSGNFATAIDVDECNNQLTITGPVIANRIYLSRAYGAGVNGGPTTSYELTAEIINFRADAWLWAYNGGYNSASGGVYEVTSIREEPPRF